MADIISVGIFIVVVAVIIIQLFFIIATRKEKDQFQTSLNGLQIELSKLGGTITASSNAQLAREVQGIRLHQQRIGTKMETIEKLTIGLQQGISTTQSNLKTDISQAREILKQMQTADKIRMDQEQQAFGAIRRLENIITGSQSRGVAGENILAQVIQQLPVEYREYGVRIGGKSVEFAIPLPNGKFLPVDSKWTSVDKIDKLQTASLDERKTLISEIEKDLMKKVDEVIKYLDPEKTIMVAIIAVPDAVYNLCGPIHSKAYKKGVIIIGYSMAIPYILSVLQVVTRFSSKIDTAQLSSSLKTIYDSLSDIDKEIEGRLSRSITQLENSRKALRTSVGIGQQTVGRLQYTTPEEQELIDEDLDFLLETDDFKKNNH